MRGWLQRMLRRPWCIQLFSGAEQCCFKRHFFSAKHHPHSNVLSAFRHSPQLSLCASHLYKRATHKHTHKHRDGEILSAGQLNAGHVWTEANWTVPIDNWTVREREPMRNPRQRLLYRDPVLFPPVWPWACKWEESRRFWCSGCTGQILYIKKLVSRLAVKHLHPNESVGS